MNTDMQTLKARTLLQIAHAKRSNRLAREAKDWDKALAIKSELSELRHTYRLIQSEMRAHA